MNGSPSAKFLRYCGIGVAFWGVIGGLLAGAAAQDSAAIRISDVAVPAAVPASQPVDLPDMTVPQPSNLAPGMARTSLMTPEQPTSQPAPAELLSELPDPFDAPARFAERLAYLQSFPRDQRSVTVYRNVTSKALESLQYVHLPQQVRMSLAEAVRRAAEHNYTIRSTAYQPAIAQAQLVQAEAVFDAVFFLDSSWQHLDPAYDTTLGSAKRDIRTVQGGFRKLLPTGMQVQTSLRTLRTELDAPRTSLYPYNPNWDTAFVTEFTQPLLRGFGLDYNRRQITIGKINRDISQSQFVQQIQETLLNVERAYWQLVFARREVAILAETLGQNWVTFQNMKERQIHDATPVELANAESNYQTRLVEYIEALKRVRDAEEALVNFINDPELKLSDDVEIVPTELPFVAALTLDHFAEVRTALERRPEISQARLAIERNRVNTAAAKNETLPQLNLNFSYEVTGIGVSADASWDNMTTDRFRSYTVGVNFAYPIGNRGPEAGLRAARLAESASVVQLHQVTDAVVQEVNTAVRTLVVRQLQIAPSLKAVQAADLNLRALQARTQRIDPAFLQTELSAVEQLAAARRTLLRVLIDYSVAVVELERAKGTLLEYNNVVVRDEPIGR